MKAFITLFIAIILFIPLSIIGFIWAIGEAISVKEKGRLSNYFWQCAVAVDQAGNTICQELFNDLFITSKGYQFGNEDETISGVIGKNKLKGTLTGFGSVLDWILENIDPNHSIKSIEDDEEIKEKYK